MTGGISDLNYAILALDSYNRYQLRGIDVPGNQIGEFSLLSVPLPSNSQAISFSAAAYLSSSGETVISYRGTDALLSDPITGWDIGGGGTFGPQFMAAFEFYNSVKAALAIAAQNNSSIDQDKISFTGHSLGGGLAGLVASFHGVDATIFANMAFEMSAMNTYNRIIRASGSYVYDPQDPEWTQYYHDQASAARPIIYGSVAPYLPNHENIHGYAVDGELLTPNRRFQDTPVEKLYPETALLGAIDLHSMALHTLLMWEKENHSLVAGWEGVATKLWSLYNSDEIGSRSGFTQANIGGVSSAGQKMAMALAYSAVSSGETPYGNTAIRAFFDDARDVSAAFELGSDFLTNGVQERLMKVFISYAGLLASHDIDAEGSDEVFGGVVKFDAEVGALSLDLNRLKWTFDSEVRTSSLTTDLIDQVYQVSTGSGQFFKALEWYADYNATSLHGYDLIGSITFDLEGELNQTGYIDVPAGQLAISTSLEGLNARPRLNSDDLLLGGGDDEALYGGSGSDILFGGAGTDELYGDEGADFLDGGDGSDVLYGGSGGDVFHVGAGDTIKDIDQLDSVYAGKRLTGGTRTTGVSNPDGESGDYYGNGFHYHYVKATKILTVTSGSTSFTIEDFVNGEAGIVLKSLDSTGPRYRPVDPIVNPGPVIATHDRNVRSPGRTGNKIEFSRDYVDPLVLDLNGDGVTLLSVADNQIYFDSMGDGVAERTGWVGPQDGLLARDLNGDGVINSNAELFGDDNTEGFVKLRTLDSNGDGWITSADAAWSSLTVWRDANSNGVTDYGELLSLAAVNVSAINLASTPDDGELAGNPLLQSGSYLTTDGQQRQIVSVKFSVVNEDTTQEEPGTIPTDVQLLPNLDGLGALPSLWAAMASDGDLADSVELLLADARTLSGTEFRARFETILLDWAGASDVASDAFGPLVDGRHMAVVQKIRNSQMRDYTDAAGQSRVITRDSTAQQIESMYRDAVDYYLLRLGTQIAPAEVALGIDVNAVTDGPFAALAGFSYDSATGVVDGFVSDVARDIAAKMPTDASAALAYLDRVAPFLQSTASLYSAGGDFNLSSDQLAGLIRQGFDEAGITDAALLEVAVSLAIPDSVAWIGTSSDDNYWDAASVVARARTITGGAGNDELVGSLLGDTFVYKAGDGDDVVYGRPPSQAARFENITDRLALVGLAPGDVSLTRDGQNVLVSINGPAGGSISLHGQLQGDAVDEIVFSDGTRWSAQMIATMIVAEEATAGDDVLFATAYDDEIVAGTGNDQVQGIGRGTDRFTYAAGDGDDQLIAAGDNIHIVLTGISADDVSLAQLAEGEVGRIVIGGASSGSIVVMGGLQKLRTITFDDNVVWDVSQISAKAIEAMTTSGDDVVIGTALSETFESSFGNDVLRGLGGDDLYRYARGHGHDVVNSFTRTTGTALLELTDIDLDEVHFEVTGSFGQDLRIVVSSDPSSTVTILGAFTPQFGVDRYNSVASIKFADGSTIAITQAMTQALAFAATDGADTISGTSGNDVIAGLAGDDQLYGYDGDDTLLGGAGNDILVGGWGRDLIVGGAGDDYINAAGHFYVAEEDVIEFTRGDGNDVVQAATGAILRLKDFDRSDLIFSRSGDMGFIVGTANPADGSVKIETAFSSIGAPDAIARILLDDGTVIEMAEVIATLLSSAGTSGNDTIVDFQLQNAVLAGGLGDDVLTGQAGETTYVFTAGDGNDVIHETGGTEADGILLHAIDPDDVTIVRSGDDALLTFASGGSLRISGQFAAQADVNYVRVVETVTFDDGTLWNAADLVRLSTTYASTITVGTSGADTLTGTSGADALSGGAGDDVLRGGAGSDRYLFGAGGGHDVIEEEGAGSTIEADILEIDGLPSDVDATRIERDLIVRLKSSGETVTVKNFFDASSGNWSPYASPETGVEFVKFSDGTIWNAATIIENAWYRATPGVDMLPGTSNAETFIGAGSASFSLGVAGHDTLHYSLGDGSVQAYMPRTDTGPDAVQLQLEDTVNIRIHNVAFEDLTFSVNDSFATEGGVTNPYADSLGDFNIRLADGGLIRLKYYFSKYTLAEAYAADTITLDNGSTYQLDQLFSLAALQGTPFNDNFSAVPFGSGLVRPGLGDDNVFFARNGSIIEWAPGDGNDNIIQAQGNGKLRLTGVERSDATFTQNGANLIISIGTEQITVIGQFSSSVRSFGDFNLFVQAGVDIEFDDALVTREGLAADFEFTSSLDGTGFLYEGHEFGETYRADAPGTQIFGRGGDDKIFAEVGGSYYILAGEGDDEIVVDSDGSTIIGDAGNDTILVTRGNTYIEGGDGNDHITVTSGQGYVVGGAGDDVINTGDYAGAAGGDGNDIITGAFGQGTYLSGGAGDDILTGTSGTFTLNGEDGNDILNGGSGNDTLMGGAGDDVYRGGAGDDVVTNETGGSDTYYWQAGDGNDTIVDNGARLDGKDRLIFEGLNKSDVEYKTEGSNLLIRLKSSGEQIRIVGQFDAQFNPGAPAMGMEEIIFDDGIVDPATILDVGLIANDDVFWPEDSGPITTSITDLLQNDYRDRFTDWSDLELLSLTSDNGGYTIGTDGSLELWADDPLLGADFSYTVGNQSLTSSAVIRLQPWIEASQMVQAINAFEAQDAYAGEVLGAGLADSLENWSRLVSSGTQEKRVFEYS